MWPRMTIETEATGNIERQHDTITFLDTLNGVSHFESITPIISCPTTVPLSRGCGRRTCADRFRRFRSSSHEVMRQSAISVLVLDDRLRTCCEFLQNLQLSRLPPNVISARMRGLEGRMAADVNVERFFQTTEVRRPSGEAVLQPSSGLERIPGVAVHAVRCRLREVWRTDAPSPSPVAPSLISRMCRGPE